MEITLYVDVPVFAKTADDLWVRTSAPMQLPGAGVTRYRVTFTLPDPDVSAEEFGREVFAQVEKERG